MESLKEKLERIKSLLEEFNNQLNSSLGNPSKIEKETQLNQITKLTEKFDKLNTTIPNEIRELKFKLMNELDQYNEVEIIKNEFNKLLEEYLTDKKIKKYTAQKKSTLKVDRKISRNNRSNVQLIDLIDKGIIQPNTYIVREYKGNILSGKINVNGEIEFKHNNDTLIFKSLSTAAEKLTGRSISGWDWWRIKGDPKSKSINFYRQKFLREGK
jgi:hypothetical protein